MLAKDVTEFLVNLEIAVAPGVRRAVAYHDACSMRNGQKVTEQPRSLLQRSGFEVHDVPENQLCCGSAGTYNILQPDIAEQLGKRKAERVTTSGAPVLAVGNIGCILQLGRYLRSMPVLHTVELLDWATGGPLPPALRGFDWPVLPAASLSSAKQAETGIW